MMEFHFKCKIAPFDFWKMSLRKIYTSPIGVCNIVFTIAIFALTFKIYNDVSDLLQVLLVLGCMLFTVLQPVILYFKAKGEVALIPQGLELDINNNRVLVTVGDKAETIAWSRFKKPIISRSMVILRMDNNAGYFLTNRAMGSDRNRFIEFLQNKAG